jgi:CheY-like chemotaxis protein
MIDMHLPDLDGPEALVELRELPGCADIPAIAISGMDEHDMRHGVTSDFAEYLTKPIDLDVLQATVARHLGRERMRSVG